MNTPNTHWNSETEKLAKEGIELARNMLAGGKFRVPCIIAGEKVFTKMIVPVFNPSNTKEKLGQVSYAGEREIRSAVTSARVHADLEVWGRLGFEERGRVFERARTILLERRFLLAGIMSLETGKSAEEASFEIAEAADMLAYYHSYCVKLQEFAKQHTRSPVGEKNSPWLRPAEHHPIALIIAPWNFPLAILCGMTVGALATGCAVVIKPAEQSTITGYFIAEILLEAGLPHGLLQFLPGNGEKTGAMLVRHPAVNIIGFTGSAEVADLIEDSINWFNRHDLPRFQTGAYSRKRFATRETGGNNALIIDESITTDLRGVTATIVRSAFGFAGQKCSALQRLVVLDVHGGFYKKLMWMLRRAINEIRVGPPEDFGNFFGPVIDDAAYKRITAFKQSVREAGGKITEGHLPDGLPDGYYVAPFVIEGLPNEHPLVQKEIFAPGLFVLHADSIEKAVDMANATRYGLTGGICSLDEAAVSYATENVRVTNFYINREITGAVVGRQGFGGTGASGSGFPAGFIFYPLNFLGMKMVSERTMHLGIPDTCDR